MACTASKSQPVEMKLFQPVERVVNHEVAHLPAALTVVVDRRAPRGVMAIGEERFGIGVEIIALRPEVVVHHVQQHHHAAHVRLLDEVLEIVGAAVSRVGREGQNAVVSPIALAGKVRQRHQLDRGYAQIRQIIQPLFHAR